MFDFPRSACEKLTKARGGSWPLPGIPSADLNVSFLRNGNHFPDSGRSHASLRWAVPDPLPTKKPLSASQKDGEQRIRCHEIQAIIK